MLMVDGPLKGLLARGVIVVDEAGKVVYEELVSEITNEPELRSRNRFIKKTNKVDYCFSLVKVKG